MPRSGDIELGRLDHTTRLHAVHHTGSENPNTSDEAQNAMTGKPLPPLPPEAAGDPTDSSVESGIVPRRYSLARGAATR